MDIKNYKIVTASFPGSLILPPPGMELQGGGKIRDPGNEVGNCNWPPSGIVTYLNRGFSCDMRNQEIHCNVFTVPRLLYLL